ncbi:MAG: KEOPS complex kinase/ATPase Bud32 [Candidatus Aenigmatarchaeota archaeon]
MDNVKTIARGAEAVILLDGDRVVKSRIVKGYRLSSLDNTLRVRRTKLEANLLRAARSAGVNTPQLMNNDSTELTMQFIDGKKVKDVLDIFNFRDIGTEMGSILARLHSANIIHGDFTTSNMIFCENKIIIIDFGLGYESNRIEDKAVDLYLFHNAMVSAHFEIVDDVWSVILKAYKEGYNDSDKVIKNFAEIQKRGRYRER